jgi:hypothetical protein
VIGGEIFSGLLWGEAADDREWKGFVMQSMISSRNCRRKMIAQRPGFPEGFPGSTFHNALACYPGFARNTPTDGTMSECL